MTPDETCPRCGAPSADRPELDGLCPACLFRVGLDDPAADDGEVWDPPSPEDLRHRFPDLEPVRLVGRGGMAAVYEARQRGLDRRVALKILSPRLARDPAFIERFRREARTLASLDHPGIVTVHDTGRVGDHLFLVMEYVDGPNLRELRRDDPPSPARAIEIVARASEALQYAHDRGVIHRDVKPENLLIDRVTGRVKIADFGLAKLLRPASTDTALTVTRVAMGTPLYMAPEQLDAPETVDARADVYAAGVVLYELLTGTLPVGRFEAPSHRAAVNVELDEVVLSALERDPERRIPTAGALAASLDRFVDRPSVPGVGPRPARAEASGPPRLLAPTAREDLAAGARAAVGTVLAWFAASFAWDAGVAGLVVFFFAFSILWPRLVLGAHRDLFGGPTPTGVERFKASWKRIDVSFGVAATIVALLFAAAYRIETGPVALLAPDPDSFPDTSLVARGSASGDEVILGGFTVRTGDELWFAVSSAIALVSFVATGAGIWFLSPRRVTRASRRRFTACVLGGLALGSLLWLAPGWVATATMDRSDLGIPMPAWSTRTIPRSYDVPAVGTSGAEVARRVAEWASEHGYAVRDRVHGRTEAGEYVESSLWFGRSVFERAEAGWTRMRIRKPPLRVDLAEHRAPILPSGPVTEVVVRTVDVLPGGPDPGEVDRIVGSLRAALAR